MLDSAALAAFQSAADDFLRAQELVAEAGQPVRPGLLELIGSATARVGECLKGLPQPYRAVRYKGLTFMLVPRGDQWSLAVLPESQVVVIQ